MYFKRIVLQLFERLQGSRKRNAPFYILRGKKSGQTVQDVAYYDLHRFFHLFPRLSFTYYETVVTQLLQRQLIVEDSDGFVQMTADGHAQKGTPFHFNGSRYRSFDLTFFRRLALLIQTISYRQFETKRFEPVVSNLLVQRWIAHYHAHRSLYDEEVARQVYRELDDLLCRDLFSSSFRTIFVYRLSSAHYRGLTYDQLATQLKLNELDVRLILKEGLHQMMDQIVQEPQRYVHLHAMMLDFTPPSPVTTSTAETARLLKEGYTLEQIASMRQLKESTIADHLVELAFHDDAFPFHQYIGEEDRRRVVQYVQQTGEMKLKQLKAVFSHLSYVQLRLALASRREK